MRSLSTTAVGSRGLACAVLVGGALAGPACGEPSGPEAAAPYLFVAGWSNTVMSYDGSDWSSMTGPDSRQFFSVWGTAPDDVYVSTSRREGGLLHYDGQAWSLHSAGWPADVFTPGWDHIMDLWGTSSSDIFAVGWGSTILHFDGSGWSSMLPAVTEENQSGTSFQGVWGSGPSDVFAVGAAVSDTSQEPLIWHYDGRDWSAMELPSDVPAHAGRLEDVWGTAPDDVWAVGDAGLVLQYDGEAWAVVPSGTSVDLNGVHTLSPTTIYVVGEEGTILTVAAGRFRASTPVSDRLFEVWAVSEDEVWAVGSGGTVVRWDGSGWTAVDTGSPAYLESIWGL